MGLGGMKESLLPSFSEYHLTMILTTLKITVDRLTRIWDGGATFNGDTESMEWVAGVHHNLGVICRIALLWNYIQGYVEFRG